MALTRNKRSLDIDDATKRALCVEASVDPRTMEKALRGEPIRGMAGYRARAALARYAAAIVLKQSAEQGEGQE